MMYVGVPSLELPQMFADAKRRILLYAPPYGSFAQSEAYVEALETALCRPGFQMLHAASLPAMDAQSWMPAFMELLRPGQRRKAVQKELDASRTFLDGLSARFGGKVSVCEMSAMPCLPIIVVDDRIFCGHFAHSTVMTAEGYWFGVDAPVEMLLHHALRQEEQQTLSPEMLAAYRLVAECTQGMDLYSRVGGE